MYKILLCCSSGLTTSKLVSAMKEEAAKQSIDTIVWAVNQTAVELSWSDADCVLVAPQNESEYKRVKDAVRETIPVGLIAKEDFINMNGKTVLDSAIELIENRRL